jgi:hypothetical protein
MDFFVCIIREFVITQFNCMPFLVEILTTLEIFTIYDPYSKIFLRLSCMVSKISAYFYYLQMLSV